MRVLLADPEDTVRAIIGDFLRDSGFSVDEARDELDIEQLSVEREYDLALVDLALPMSALKSLLTADPDLPVVATASLLDRDILQRVERLGAVALVGKPFTLSGLGRILHMARHIKSLRR